MTKKNKKPVSKVVTGVVDKVLNKKDKNGNRYDTVIIDKKGYNIFKDHSIRERDRIKARYKDNGFRTITEFEKLKKDGTTGRRIVRQTLYKCAVEVLPTQSSPEEVIEFASRLEEGFYNSLKKSEGRTL